MNQLRAISPPRTGLVSTLLWLIFALSFIWFPYLGMVTFPCRNSKDSTTTTASRFSTPWSPYSQQDNHSALNFTATGQLVHNLIQF